MRLTRPFVVLSGAALLGLPACSPPPAEPTPRSARFALTAAVWNEDGSAANAVFGYSVDGAGDVNGDGYEDVLVGAPLMPGGGGAFLYLGSPSGPTALVSWSIGGGCSFGESVQGLGDVNGDGYGDFAVGDTCGLTANGYTGSVHVWYGQASIAALPTAAPLILTNGVVASRYGEGLGGAGDTNGDGFADLVVGAPGWSLGGGAEGQALLYLGSAAGLLSAPLWTLQGTQTDGELGGGVAGAGDVDGDGRADVLIASPRFDTPTANAGSVQLYGGVVSGSPPALWTFNGTQVSVEVGHALAGVGDVDGDGYADFALSGGAYSSSVGGEGCAWVYTAPGGNVSLTPRIWTGTVPFGGLGSAISAAGDVNGDGYADVLVGSSGINTASVYLGGAGGVSSGAAFTTIGPADSGLGGAVGSAGDVDGDGLGDLLIGAPFSGLADEGSAQVHLGRRALPSSSPEATLEGIFPGDQMGADVAMVGDVDGDGTSDLLVGTQGHDGGFSDEGSASLYLGGTSNVLSATAWSGAGGQAGAAFGSAVAGGGDVDGDGYADWVVGARSFDPPALTNAGQVRLYLGGPGTLASTPAATRNGAVANALLGSDVAMGDVNGDGFADVIAGARLHTNGQSNEGAVFLWLGSAGGLPAAPSWSFESGVVGAQLGDAVAFVGDTDGDGFGDLLVGAPGYSGTLGLGGAAFLFPGSLSGPTAPSFAITGSAAGGLAQLGAAVAGVGDLDGDGLDDILLGAPLSASTFSDEGAVALFRGRPTPLGVEASPSWVRYGGAASALLGEAMAAAGDADSDGLADLWIGAPGLGSGGTVMLFLGISGGVPTMASAMELTGGQAGQQFSGALSAGDLDGDGVPELAAGSTLYDSTASGNEGRVIVWRGNSDAGRGAHPDPPALRVDDAGQPRAAWGRLGSASTLDVTTDGARSPFGGTGLHIELEVKPLGAPFTGAGTSWVLGAGGYSAPSQLGGTATGTATGLTPDAGHHWRARLRYDPASAPPQSWGPWVVGGRPGETAGVHVRTGCTSDLDADGVCDPVDPDDDGDGVAGIADGGLDCDDTDATVFPAATELCDAVDSDCDGDVVEADLDTDGDLLPDCADDDDDADGTSDDLDCAPLDDTQHPAAAEACDGLDNDCDGVVPADEADADGDGVRVCALDCDDHDADTYPAAPERLDCLDNDCDGVTPPSETADGDLDGHSACVDCADDVATVNPSSPELCDGLDSDCDGDLDADGVLTGELDGDGDGFAECAGDCDDAQAVQFPGAPEALDASEDLNCDGTFGLADADGDGVTIVDLPPDCDDDDAARFPGNPEVCDAVDNDCDGALAAGELGDGDGDGFLACEDCNDAAADVHPGLTEVCDGFDTNCDGYVGAGDFDADFDGWAPCGGDCDDEDAAVHPGQSEDAGCLDGLDNDCDGTADVAADVDGDGVSTCDGDCADDDNSIAPGQADDQCDGIDDDCDGADDDGADADGDGVPRCGAGPDCDDADATVFPGAPELCADGLDNDCDPATLPFLDADGDGFAPCPDGDCDDGNGAVGPGNAESCDGLDNDCDGTVDDGLDADGDGLLACTGDCAEGEPTVRAGLAEVCDDGLDNDCDRDVDEDCDGGPTGQPLDVVFPAGCVCDADGPARAPSLLLLLLPLAALKRRVRRRCYLPARATPPPRCPPRRPPLTASLRADARRAAADRRGPRARPAPRVRPGPAGRRLRRGGLAGRRGAS